MTSYKSFRPEFKALDEAGTVRFVVATLGEVDKDSDVTLPGFFGKQHVPMVPVHDWNHIPIGKGQLFEEGNEAIVEAKFNLNIPEAKAWYEAVKFDMDHPPALQEYSYGYQVLDGGSKSGEHNGQKVRYLQPREDGSPGVKVFEVSPVLSGAGTTRTLAVKSEGMKFADQGAAVLTAVSEYVDRAERVVTLRQQEKGRGLGAESQALVERIRAQVKRLGELLEADGTRTEQEQVAESVMDSTAALEREYLRFLRTVTS